ncbi:MAG: hypothetical protein JWP82_481 [Humibacillus sp.]|nr:hypothetical protein [Humibacillus sp.]
MRRSVVSGLSAALVLGSSATLGAVSAAAAPATVPTAAPTVNPAAPAATTGVADGTYVPLSPARLADTRGGSFARKLNAGEVFDVKVTGRGGVPSSGVMAVVLNLTVTGPTGAGNVVAYPKGAAVPNASSLNFVADDTRSNLVTVPVSSDGWVSIRNAVGQTHVVADVQGYYVGSTAVKPAGAVDYFPQDPWRVVDTRPDGRVPAGNAIVGSANFGPDTADITALAVNVTVVKPQTKGYALAWAWNAAAPSTSNVNFAAGQTTPNMVIVPVGHETDTDGTPYANFVVGNASQGEVDILVDVVGVYAAGDGLRFRSAGTPRRIVDTRTSVGTTTLGPATTRTVAAPTTVANVNTVALVTNTTAVRPTAATFLTLWQTGVARSSASNLNPAAGQTVANMAIVNLSDPPSKFNIFNNAGTTDVLVDVAGRFDISPAVLGAPKTFSGKAARQHASALAALRR